MPVAEITRTETSERARLLRVDDYDIELDLTRGGEVFGSTSGIRFSCSQPGASTPADLIAPAVREITLNGVAIDPAEAYADGRIALTGLAERNELRVVADCGYTNTGVGMHRAVDSADSKVYLYTQFEPAEARKVFANFEQPDLKAAFTFHVTAPAHWTVMSNEPTPEPEPAGSDGKGGAGGQGWEGEGWAGEGWAGGGWAGGANAVGHFPATPRIPPYL